MEEFSQESADRIARAIKAEIAEDTQYCVVLVPPHRVVTFLAEFPPGDAVRLFRDVADDIETSVRRLEAIEVKEH